MKISKAGIIAVPSKYAEYLRFEKQQAIQNNQTGELFSGYRGFFHHRWICGMKDDVFVGYEKSNYWEIIAMPNYETDKGFFTEVDQQKYFERNESRSSAKASNCYCAQYR